VGASDDGVLQDRSASAKPAQYLNAAFIRPVEASTAQTCVRLEVSRAQPSLNLGGTQITDIGVARGGTVFAAATGSNQDETFYPLLQRSTN